MVSYPSINKGRFVGESHLLCLLQKFMLRNPNFLLPCCTDMSSSFLFITWRKEKKRKENEEMMIKLSSKESGRCVVLVTVKGL